MSDMAAVAGGGGGGGYSSRPSSSSSSSYLYGHSFAAGGAAAGVYGDVVGRQQPQPRPPSDYPSPGSAEVTARTRRYQPMAADK